MAEQHDVCNTAISQLNNCEFSQQSSSYQLQQSQYCVSQHNFSSNIGAHHQNQCLPDVNYGELENSFISCPDNGHFSPSSTSSPLIQNFKHKNGFQNHGKFNNQQQFYQTEANIQQNVEYNQRNYHYPQYTSETPTNYQNYPSQQYLNFVRNNVFTNQVNEMNMLVPNCQSSGSSEASDDSSVSNNQTSIEHNMTRHGGVRSNQMLFSNQVNFNFQVPPLQQNQVRNCQNFNKEIGNDYMDVMNDGNIPRCDSNKSETAESTCSSLSSGSTESQNEEQANVVHLPLLIENQNQQLVNLNQAIQIPNNTGPYINRSMCSQYSGGTQNHQQQNKLKFNLQNRNPNSNIVLIPNNSSVLSKSNNNINNIPHMGLQHNDFTPTELNTSQNNFNHQNYNKKTVNYNQTSHENVTNLNLGLQISSPVDAVKIDQVTDNTSVNNVISQKQNYFNKDNSNMFCAMQQHTSDIIPPTMNYKVNDLNINNNHFNKNINHLHTNVYSNNDCSSVKMYSVVNSECNNLDVKLQSNTACDNSDKNVITQIEHGTNNPNHDYVNKLNCLKIPFGWKRILVDGSIIYLSPSNIALSTLEQVKIYLQTGGTCKCGLECPFDCDSVFNFDPKVVSRPRNPLDADLTKLCNHKRKLSLEDHNNVKVQDDKGVVAVKRKKKKHGASYGPTSVYQLLAQRERQMAAVGQQQQQQQQPPPQQQQPNQNQVQQRWQQQHQPPPPPHSLPPPTLEQLPSVTQQQQQQYIGYPPTVQNGQFLLMPNLQPPPRTEMKEIKTAPLAAPPPIPHSPPRSNLQYPLAPDQLLVKPDNHPAIAPTVPYTSNAGAMQKPRSIPPWHQAKLGVKKSSVVLAPPPPPQQQSQPLIYDRVPPLQQHMAPHVMQQQQQQQKKKHKARVKKRTSASSAHDFQPSFMDDPNAYLAQQTALLHNTISRPNLTMQESGSSGMSVPLPSNVLLPPAPHPPTGNKQQQQQQQQYNPRMMINPLVRSVCQNPCCSGDRRANAMVDDSVTSSSYSYDSKSQKQSIVTDTRPIQGGTISTSNGSPQPQPQQSPSLIESSQSPVTGNIQISSTSTSPFVIPIPIPIKSSESQSSQSPVTGNIQISSTSTSPFVIPIPIKSSESQSSPKNKQLVKSDVSGVSSSQQQNRQQPHLQTQDVKHYKTMESVKSLPTVSAHTQSNLNILKSSLEVVQNIVSNVMTPQNIVVRNQVSPTSAKSPGGVQTGILVSNNGQYIVTSNGNIVPQANLLSPTGALKLSHTQQVLTQPTVLLNTIPTPFVIQPGVMTVDTGLTVATGATGVLQGGNIVEAPTDKGKKKCKKRKNQVNVLQMASPNGVLLNQPFATTVSPTGGTQQPHQQQHQQHQPPPMLQTLTLLPNKQQTSQIVMNSAPQHINLLQPVNLTSVPTIQQFILPGLGNVVMSTDGTAALLPDNLGMQLQLQNVNGQNVLTPVQNTSFINSQGGILTTSAGMLIRTPNQKIVQSNSPQFLSPNNHQFLVNGTFQGQLSPLITTNLSPNQQIFHQTTSPRCNQSPQEFIHIVPTSNNSNNNSNSNSQNTTVVQQNTTIVQQQTTMVSNNNIVSPTTAAGVSGAGGSGKKSTKKVDNQHSVSTQTFVNVGTTHSPADTTTSDDGSSIAMVQYVSSTEQDVNNESLHQQHGYRMSATDENMVSSHTDLDRILDKHVVCIQTNNQHHHQQQQQQHHHAKNEFVRRAGAPCEERTDTCESNEQGTNVRVGDLVWGSANGSPAWPGKIVRPVSPGGRGWVKWFGLQSTSPTRVHVRDLQTLSQGLEAHHRASNKHRKSRKLNSQLESAIQEAMLELDRVSTQQKKVENGHGRTRRTQR